MHHLCHIVRIRQRTSSRSALSPLAWCRAVGYFYIDYVMFTVYTTHTHTCVYIHCVRCCVLCLYDYGVTSLVHVLCCTNVAVVADVVAVIASTSTPHVCCQETTAQWWLSASKTTFVFMLSTSANVGAAAVAFITVRWHAGTLASGNNVCMSVCVRAVSRFGVAVPTLPHLIRGGQQRCTHLALKCGYKFALKLSTTYEVMLTRSGSSLRGKNNHDRYVHMNMSTSGGRLWRFYPPNPPQHTRRNIC